MVTRMEYQSADGRRLAIVTRLERLKARVKLRSTEFFWENEAYQLARKQGKEGNAFALGVAFGRLREAQAVYRQARISAQPDREGAR